MIAPFAGRHTETSGSAEGEEAEAEQRRQASHPAEGGGGLGDRGGQQGGNSIGIFLGPESGPESCPNMEF